MNETRMAAGHPLSAELALYGSRRQVWVREGHEGKWVVVHGERVLGFHQTIGEGFREAAKTLQPGTFLVKRVTREDRVHTIQQVS